MTDEKMMADRLVNLLITEHIPLGALDSPLRHDVTILGRKMRRYLASNPTCRFRFQKEADQSEVISDENPPSFRHPISKELEVRLKRLNAFFQRNRAIKKKLISSARLKQAFLSPRTVAKIKNLIQKDQKLKFSELGGVASIHPNKPEVYFIPIDSDYTDIAKELWSYRNDTDKALTWLVNHREKLPFLPVRAKRTIDILSSNADNKTKRSSLDSFINIFMFYVRHSYLLSQSRQYAFLAEVELPGIYLGVFHVHPPQNRPSIEDKLESIVRRNIVVVPLAEGFEIHYLYYGADPNVKPLVIRYRESVVDVD